jgi:competence protein ComEA
VKKLKLWVKGFFGFSRAETNAFFILIPLMVLLIFSEPAFRYWFVRQPRDYSKEKHHLDSLVATMEWPSDSVSTDRKREANNLFVFDPNRSTKEDFLRLGFGEALSNRIINYRTKGGNFATKKDLKKIYGMDSVFFRKLSPYIKLPETITRAKSVFKLEVKEKPLATRFDLNTADTSQLVKIYGIGFKLAKRIITYRSKLGGFVTSNQLNEVYGLDSTVVTELFRKSFISESFQPTRINVNTATEKSLAGHPYVKYKLAKAITAYRAQHGPFGTIDDLKKIAIIDEADFQKMRPYLVSQ